MVKHIHDKLYHDKKMQDDNKNKNPASPAPTFDDRPHWCSDCRAAGKKMRHGPCPGHGKRDGGGGDEAKAGASDELITSGSVAAVLAELINKPDAKIIEAEEVKKLNEILDTQFNPELLTDLIHGSLKLISIKSEADIGKLTIEWHPEFLSKAVLSDEIKRELIRFINAIERELETFVNQNKIQVNNFTKDINIDNYTGIPKSLIITFANRNHYESFYKQLDKNVLSQIDNFEMKEDKKCNDVKGDKKFHPTPTSTKFERK